MSKEDRRNNTQIHFRIHRMTLEMYGTSEINTCSEKVVHEQACYMQGTTIAFGGELKNQSHGPSAHATSASAESSIGMLRPVP